jgi:uncharacterized UBP type Zn finger protein
MNSDLPCSHLELAAHRAHAADPTALGCEECLATGSPWVHLRLCLGCGHVGCCDNSPNRHATKHFRRTQHPVIRSFEPGEDWAFCYRDSLMVSDFPAQPGEAAPVHYG